MRHTPPYERLVLGQLRNGPMRFVQLAAATGATTTASLCRTLKRLHRQGVITRTVLVDEAPTGTLYALATKEQPATE
jgi:DNA-binding HxlR family transcriptional regulator